MHYYQLVPNFCPKFPFHLYNEVVDACQNNDIIIEVNNGFMGATACYMMELLQLENKTPEFHVFDLFNVIG